MSDGNLYFSSDGLKDLAFLPHHNTLTLSQFLFCFRVKNGNYYLIENFELEFYYHLQYYSCSVIHVEISATLFDFFVNSCLHKTGPVNENRMLASIYVCREGNLATCVGYPARLLKVVSCFYL